MTSTAKTTARMTTAMLSVLLGTGASVEGATYDEGATWEGWYGGGHIGAGFADSLLAPGSEGLRLGAGGALAGLQAGYNWDEGDWAWGIEADIGPSFMRAGYSTQHYNAVQMLGSLRARIGIIRNDNWAYVTAGVGVVFGHDMSSRSSRNASFTKPKAVLGIGAEHKISESMSIRAEGLGYFFTNTISVASEPTRLKTIFTARLGVNFHF